MRVFKLTSRPWLRATVQGIVVVSIFVSLSIFVSAQAVAAEAPTYACEEWVPNPRAAADVITDPSDFLPCSEFPYALCYYSGPDPMTCVRDENGSTATCECYYVDALDESPSGTVAGTSTRVNFVDKESILNRCVAEETEAFCSTNDCSKVDAAPVCWYLKNRPQIFAPPSFGTVDTVSTFSFAEVEGASIGCTQCSGTYAGCMTAPCKLQDDGNGGTIAKCVCPLATGPYQVGQNDQACDLSAQGAGLVWSAASNLLDDAAGKCVPLSEALP